MNGEENKDCLNCAHFLRYFIIDKYGNVSKIHKGHCINSAIRKRSNRTFELCGQWQECEPDTAQRDRTIKHILIALEYYLKQLDVAIKYYGDLDTHTD